MCFKDVQKTFFGPSSGYRPGMGQGLLADEVTLVGAVNIIPFPIEPEMGTILIPPIIIGLPSLPVTAIKAKLFLKIQTSLSVTGVSGR